MTIFNFDNTKIVSTTEKFLLEMENLVNFFVTTIVVAISVKKIKAPFFLRHCGKN